MLDQFAARHQRKPIGGEVRGDDEICSGQQRVERGGIRAGAKGDVEFRAAPLGRTRSLSHAWLFHEALEHNSANGRCVSIYSSTLTCDDLMLRRRRVRRHDRRECF